MKYVLMALGIIVALIVLVVVALWIKFQIVSGRYIKHRMRKLGPVLGPLLNHQSPDPAVVREFAADPEIRSELYEIIAGLGDVQTFPEEFRTFEKLAESDLIRWLSHPHELHGPPDEIKLVKTMTIPTKEAGDVRWCLFAFRTNPPHWAAKHGWMVGASGPYSADLNADFESPAGTFSKLDALDSRSPEEHVRHLHDFAVSRGALVNLIGSYKLKQGRSTPNSAASDPRK